MFITQNGKCGLYVCLLFALAYADKACDKMQCKGPLRIYEELRCKPVYANPGDCCAVRYDCSHLDRRSTDKCYANGREYAVGEKLKKEDIDDTCLAECQCTTEGKFNCTYLNITLPELPRPDCYRRYTLNTCPATVICPKAGEERAKCEYQGKTYLDGEPFSLKDRQDVRCLCSEGFKEENVESFCSRSSCAIERNDYPEIRKNCAPIYYADRRPQLSCASTYKCQEEVDQIIRASSEKPSESSDMKCKYGKLLLNPSDRVKRNYFNLRCASCECEVPPYMTCRQISFSECGLPPSTTSE